MRITCPYCGERPVEEFTFQGDAAPRRPAQADTDMDAMYDYVYLRNNPRGRISEYWHHGAGCRSWLIVERNTETHEVYGVTAARDRKQRKRAK
jgi:sarcosine oxidase subunit delta